jgi:hypothetical protein
VLPSERKKIMIAAKKTPHFIKFLETLSLLDEEDEER